MGGGGVYFVDGQSRLKAAMGTMERLLATVPQVISLLGNHLGNINAATERAAVGTMRRLVDLGPEASGLLNTLDQRSARTAGIHGEAQTLIQQNRGEMATYREQREMNIADDPVTAPLDRCRRRSRALSSTQHFLISWMTFPGKRRRGRARGAFLGNCSAWKTRCVNLQGE